MNEMVVKTRHKVFLSNPVPMFCSKIDNSAIIISSRGDELTIHIKTRKNEDNSKHLFFDIYSMLYICLGAFPKIESMMFNERRLDIDHLAKKYYTRESLFRNDLRIANICGQTINQAIIDKYRIKQQEPISSLQYLDSAGYDSIVADHRITLLLHIIDGICDAQNAVLKAIGAEMIKKYKLNATRQKNLMPDDLGKYIRKAYMVTNECLFYYHRKFNCEILKLMHISQYEFLCMLSDTRNWNSHFLNKNKPNRIKDGTKIVIFFEIVHYMIRIKIAKDIGIKPDEVSIKEYYYTVHDWILDILYNRADALKSETYSKNKRRKEFQKAIKSFPICRTIDSQQEG